MGRETVKVVGEFRDFIRHVVTDPEFPIKTITQIVTLSTLKWLKNYDKSTQDQKKKLVDEMIRLQKQAEEDGYLHNSREIKNDN
jgi:hypothetical protein